MNDELFSDETLQDSQICHYKYGIFRRVLYSISTRSKFHIEDQSFNIRDGIPNSSFRLPFISSEFYS